MIKLTAIEPQTDTSLLLHFSDGSAGVFDFSAILATHTEMTSPLLDPAYFRRCFIELGALAWPNGLDFSAASLHQRLESLGALKRDDAAA
ncbi:DUF2442 domain-containing protein [Aquimonas voraii]|jgi:hypothetical protein|uniref:DUF2442 domain-containing protein n=1 Tax=Aquimonas voraii TaxID=265719 RepID=A0A1G6URA0_9GAMM|nr:DUF2442 domain-containing protein [Aquimonas voraii]SDD43862.1 Protein of unknown function [Aquimonas voraii]